MPEKVSKKGKFQSTPSSQKVTGRMKLYLLSQDVFQSTPSSQKVTRWGRYDGHGHVYFNPHLPHRRWRSKSIGADIEINISIHTFLTEGDQGNIVRPRHTGNISIHTFLTEGDYATSIGMITASHFNPHLPHRRWLKSIKRLYYRYDFNPHLPHRRWLVK